MIVILMWKFSYPSDFPPFLLYNIDPKIIIPFHVPFDLSAFAQYDAKMILVDLYFVFLSIIIKTSDKINN